MPQPVQQATPVSQASGTTASVIFGSNVTVGNLVTVCISQNAGFAAATISGLGATWTQIVQDNFSGPLTGSAIYAGICVTVGTTLSLSALTSTGTIITAQEWSGYLRTTNQAGTNSGSAATSGQASLAAITFANCLILGVISVSVNETLTSPGSPWNTLTEGAGQTGIKQAASWQIVTVTGTYQPTWTFASANFTTGAAAFMAAIGGYRSSFKPPFKTRHRHYFTNPQHVRIYHPKPAQYETLLVPVVIRLKRPRTRIHWKQPSLRIRLRYKHLGGQMLALAAPRRYRPRKILPRRPLLARLRRFQVSGLLIVAFRPRYKINRGVARWHRTQRLVKRLGTLQPLQFVARVRASRHPRAYLPITTGWRSIVRRAKRFGQMVVAPITKQLLNNPLIKSLGKMMHRIG